MRPAWCARIIAWCSCIMAAGCVHFQTGPSEPIAADERLMLGERGQLHVIDKNPHAAETVLLVHGYGASSASYLPVIDALASRFRVLAIDLPGFGKSDRRAGDYSPEALADVLAEVLQQKGVARAHVVGHSWGSSVVLAFARRHPDRLARLVVISGWMYDEQLLPMMRWARLPGLGEWLYGSFYRQNIGERLYLNFVDPALVTQRVVDEVERQMALEGAVAAALAAARGMRFSATEGEYHTITQPTLVMWGREDRVARLPFGERLARELPHARLVVLPRCGHIPMWECTGETTAALSDFLSAK
jgi:pimeloyl-ACP methyl ester carboxylesterase